TALLDLAPIPGTEDCWVTKLLTVLDPFIRGVREEMHAMAREHYVAKLQEDTPKGAKERSVTRLDVILKSDPFDPESAATLKLIQTWLDKLPEESFVGPVQAECFGITA